MIHCHNTAFCFCVVPDSTKNPNLNLDLIQRQSRPIKEQRNNRKLKPCPYCGCGESDIRLVSDNKNLFVYVCSCCGKTPVGFSEAKPTIKDAIKIWNERA